MIITLACQPERNVYIIVFMFKYLLSVVMSLSTMFCYSYIFFFFFYKNTIINSCKLNCNLIFIYILCVLFLLVFIFWEDFLE